MTIINQLDKFERNDLAYDDLTKDAKSMVGKYVYDQACKVLKADRKDQAEMLNGMRDNVRERVRAECRRLFDSRRG